MGKNLPAMQETQVWSLGWEDSLEKETATHSSILAWRIPWTEKPCGLQSIGLQRIGQDQATNIFTFTVNLTFIYLYKGKKIPILILQTPSCLHFRIYFQSIKSEEISFYHDIIVYIMANIMI